MKQLELNDKQISNNAYINFSSIYSYKDVKNYLDLDLIDSNIPIPFDDFFSMLSQFEEKFNPCSKKENSNVRYGVLLTYLLDSSKKEADILAITHSIVEYFNYLPYYCWKKKKGKGNYLVFYFCEREFYFNGIKDTYAKDIYQNKKTGKMCSKEDINAILIHKKGEIKDADLIYFSKRKADTFKFKDKSHFVEAFFKFRSWYMHLLSKFYHASIKQGVTFKKYVLSCLSKNNRVSASKWNKTISILEDSFDNAIYLLKRMGELNSFSEEKLYDLYKHYQFLIKSRSFSLKLGKRKTSIKINFESHKENYDLLIKKFEEDKLKLIQSCL